MLKCYCLLTRWSVIVYSPLTLIHVKKVSSESVNFGVESITLFLRVCIVSTGWPESAIHFHDTHWSRGAHICVNELDHLLVQIMNYRLKGTKPLSKAMLDNSNLLWTNPNKFRHWVLQCCSWYVDLFPNVLNSFRISLHNFIIIENAIDGEYREYHLHMQATY